MSEPADAPPAAMTETDAYWSGAQDGRLMIRHCNACDQNHHYPRPFCPFCMSADTCWLQASGDAVIYSYTVLRRGPAPAFVTLEEGPTMMTAIVDCDPGQLAVGQKVSARFCALAEGGPVVPVFAPMAG